MAFAKPKKGAKETEVAAAPSQKGKKCRKRTSAAMAALKKRKREEAQEAAAAATARFAKIQITAGLEGARAANFRITKNEFRKVKSFGQLLGKRCQATAHWC